MKKPVRIGRALELASAAVLLPALTGTAAAQNAASCERLASEGNATVRITAASVVAAGAFTPPPPVLVPGQNPPPPPPATPPPPPNQRRATTADAGFGLGMNGGRANARYPELPAFCRVTATLAPP